jgi:colanic acid/amylovoran biosynthesis glycosyltransferase
MARREGPTTVIDDAGRSIAFGFLRQLWETNRVLWQRMHLWLHRGDVMIHAAKQAPPPVPAKGGNLDGPVVVVLPVLPDMSHTFVYRELLAILEQRPNWQVIALNQNHQAPVHDEARRLLDRVQFLPREGMTRTFWRATLGLWFRRRVRQLFGMYRMQADAESQALLSKETLRDPRHPGNALLLAAMLRPLKPRHIHVYASTWPANVAMGASFLLDVPFSISSYVDFEFPYSHKLLDQKVHRATFFRVVTKYCQRQLKTLQPEIEDDRIPVVYLGLDLNNWNETYTAPNRGVLVSAARIVAKKGLHLMPEALAILKKRDITFSWRVIGDGPELDRLRQLTKQHGVEEQVEFLGASDNKTVRSALMHADAAILPCVVADDGERDGIPIFFLEAMALGVPVITTPISGIPELIRDDDTGFLHATSDVNALAEQIAYVLGDTENAKRIGARGRDEVHLTLNVHDAATQLISEIER